MGTMTAKSTSIVAFLKDQHEHIAQLFARVLAAEGEEREQTFYELRRLLAVHETAEEEIVHPAARKAIAGGEAIVTERLAEENEAKKVLAELEELDLASPEFEQKLQTLQTAVLAHAKAEETQEFAGLGENLPAEKLRTMKKAAELAEAVAPTRPHPGVESQGANLLAGPFASMLDRARDALTGKS